MFALEEWRMTDTVAFAEYNSFDDDPWIVRLVEFTRKVLQQKHVRLIGVCFGHQIIGRALDVKVDRSEHGWEVSVVKVDLTKRGKELFGLEDLVRRRYCLRKGRC
jgi:GMP synthase-like glutamine amidotransferase